jgi:acyl-CoA thioester hydrolase
LASDRGHSKGVTFSTTHEAIWYNLGMNKFQFFTPIEIRYSDLDPQWHVNHARILSLMEHARTRYLINLGLFDGLTFSHFPTIVANINVSYLTPINPDQKIRVATRILKIGNKSITYEIEVQDADSGEVMSRSETVTVAYDYENKCSMRVPEEWRRKIAEFEGLAT